MISVLDIETQDIVLMNNFDPSYDKIKIRDVIRASMSIAGIFNPVEINGRKYTDPGFLQTDNAYNVMKYFKENI